MKIIRLLAAALLFCSLPANAQYAAAAPAPVAGTWMITTGNSRAIKMLSPTHVFLMSFSKDSLTHAAAGTYHIAGNTYTEHMQYDNIDRQGAKDFTFNYTVSQDSFIQKGDITLPNGTTVSVNEHFARVKSNKQYNGPYVGTWNLLSSTETDQHGNKQFDTNAHYNCYQLVTPTHWMRIYFANGHFARAMEGTYTANGNTLIAKVEHASFPTSGAMSVTITLRFKGNNMYETGIVQDGNGKQTSQFEDVFEKVTAPQ